MESHFELRLRRGGSFAHFVVLAAFLAVGAEALRFDEPDQPPSIASLGGEHNASTTVNALSSLNGSSMLNLSMAMMRSKSVAKNCLTTRWITKLNLEGTNPLALEAWRQTAAAFPKITSNVLEQKIAFLVLVSESWPAEGIWADWLRDVDPKFYTVKIHSSTGTFRPRFDIFRDSVLPFVIEGLWCAIAPIMLGMVRAVLGDPAITRFAFFCQSTLPVKQFAYTYELLTKNGGNDPSVMCADMDWTRGMPFSYVWGRNEATLFAMRERELTAMFANLVGVCDAEDFFVAALSEAKIPFYTGCVTWSAWVQEKGFSLVTNGLHYDRLVGDPRTVLSAVSDCQHPFTIRVMTQELLLDLWRDEQFAFARKFVDPLIGGVATAGGALVRLDEAMHQLYHR
eukprot:TRINITY_DN4561_c0_g1_i1.p1 TRINITY_DN4561_c0_g1~~TRINITY_DN4561_c0_g1_i1.p1  ORF type:complete len:397 (+),score=61.69 TRINITY_DN4561_c0_g1_i1:88-1278(+)